MKLSKSVDPIQPIDIQTSENGIVMPSPPKPVRPHLTASRRSSTGNIAKQKLGDHNLDTRRAQSGPTNRTSPRNNVVETRAKSSPNTGRQERDTSGENTNSFEDESITSERRKLSRLYKEHVRPILKEMDSNLKQDEAKSLCENCQRLLGMLKKVGILPETKTVEVSSFKGQILKCLFSYLGVKDPRLHLRLAKIVLMVCACVHIDYVIEKLLGINQNFCFLLQFNLSESNEENIFKLLFKVSRDENNDQIFLEEEVTGTVETTGG